MIVLTAKPMIMSTKKTFQRQNTTGTHVLKINEERVTSDKNKKIATHFIVWSDRGRYNIGTDKKGLQIRTSSVLVADFWTLLEPGHKDLQNIRTGFEGLILKQLLNTSQVRSRDIWPGVVRSADFNLPWHARAMALANGAICMRLVGEVRLPTATLIVNFVLLLLRRDFFQ